MSKQKKHPKPTGPVPSQAHVQTQLLGEIQTLIQSARQRAAVAVNAELSLLYWQVGQRIQQEMLQGQRADYGKQLIQNLSVALTFEYGKGWSTKQLRHCLRFVEIVSQEQKVSVLRRQLSWSHLRILMHQEGTLTGVKFNLCYTQTRQTVFSELQNFLPRLSMVSG